MNSDQAFYPVHKSNTQSNGPLTWLASYPKSGNTWLRFAVAALLQPDFSSSAEVQAEVPDVHERPFQPKYCKDTQCGFAKTHFQFSQTMPYREHTAAFIYIYRNPIDVLISNYNYYLRTSNISMEASEDQNLKELYVDAFLQHAGDPRWEKTGFGSWVDNLKSWLIISKNYPSLFIKYEDMKADPMETISRLVKFLNLEKTEEDIRKVVHTCSFKQMQQLEKKEMAEKIPGMFYYPDANLRFTNTHKFVRKGRSDFGKSELPQSLRDKAITCFKPVLDWLNYEVEMQTV